MKNFCLKSLFTILFAIFSIIPAHALQFDLLVLPVDLFNICDNYFCFVEPSEIAANSVIKNLQSYRMINVTDLAEVRARLSGNSELKNQTQSMLNQYKNDDKIDFTVLDNLSNEFGVKSIILISSYVTTDKAPVKRGLWEILEINSAFKTIYPYTLITSVVLTDTVNNVVMWSAKYNKNVSDSNGNFMALNQAQAASHLEKIKQYYQNIVSVAIAQNVYLRFFPHDVRTFKISKPDNAEDEAPKFVPNALDHLVKPQMIRELEQGSENTVDPADDFIFTF